jgi:hypothetical protein
MTLKETTPTEIKGFIKTLKEQNICQWIDQRGNYLFIPATNPRNQAAKTTTFLLKSLFHEHCPSLDWKDWDNYVLASLPKVVGYSYDPLAGEYIYQNDFAKTKLINKYRPPQQKIQLYSDVTPFTDYMARMFPASDERHTVMQWLAHMFQLPHQRPSFHIMVTSDQGTGKGYLFKEILEPLLQGLTSTCEQSYAPFFDKHSHHLNCTQLCILDDCVDTGRNTYSRMKNSLSEEWTTYEQKFLDPMPIKIYTRIWLNSNQVRPLRVDEQDRRWFAPKYIEKSEGVHTSVYLEKMDYYLANKNGLNQIYNYFLTYSLDGFNHKMIDQTDTLKDIIGLSVSTIEKKVSDWIVNKVAFKNDDLVSYFSDEPDLARSYASAMCRRTNANLDGTGKSRWWVLKGKTNKEVKEFFNNKRLF